MKMDTVLRQEGMDALIEKLGKVDAERFISLIIKEPFDLLPKNVDHLQC